MVSTVLSRLVCFLCVVVIPATLADVCSSYHDSYGVLHDTESCAYFCCGNCHRKYCCYSGSDHFTEAAQKLCPKRRLPRYSYGQSFQITVAFIVALILCLLLAGLVICCFAPCCWCYKTCQNARNRRHTNVANSIAVFHSPQQLISPPGYQQSHPGYQSVPVYLGSAMPPTPPPPYVESISPAYSPAAFGQSQPMYHLQPPSQPSAPPLYSDESVPSPPYNPSYIGST